MNVATTTFSSDEQRFAILEIGSHSLGLDIRNLAEVCVIHQVLPLVCMRKEVLGAIDLRGLMIPLLDGRALCNQPSMEELPTLAAILEWDGNLVAIGIDRPSAILKFQESDIQSLYGTGQLQESHVRKGLISDGRSISVIEPESVLNLPNLPSCKAVVRGKRKVVETNKVAYLTFEAGGAHFSLEATRIFGTVPRQEITVGTLTGGDCLGTITYLGRRVPVMDATRVFGLGSGLTKKQPEIVIMRFPDDRLLGFAVDVISHISMIKTADMHSPPGVFGTVETLFSSVIVQDQGRVVFVLEADRLIARNILSRMSTLSDKTIANNDIRETKAKPLASKDGGIDKVSYSVIRCLVFTAGLQVACRITQVVSILPEPETIIPTPTANSAILGLFPHDGSVVPLISMPHLLGHMPEPEAGMARVLLTGPPDRRIGFRVDSVDGIESSDFLAAADKRLRISDRMVKLQSDEFKRGLIPYLDLDALSKTITIPAK